MATIYRCHQYLHLNLKTRIPLLLGLVKEIPLAMYLVKVTSCRMINLYIIFSIEVAVYQFAVYPKKTMSKLDNIGTITSSNGGRRIRK
jgi:hypothetical protein